MTFDFGLIVMILFILNFDTCGTNYTWFNGRRGTTHTQMRLDRSICNEDWIYFGDTSACCTLTLSQSDHYPFLLPLHKGPCSFSNLF